MRDIATYSFTTKFLHSFLEQRSCTIVTILYEDKLLCPLPNSTKKLFFFFRTGSANTCDGKTREWVLDDECWWNVLDRRVYMLKRRPERRGAPLLWRNVCLLDVRLHRHPASPVLHHHQNSPRPGKVPRIRSCCSTVVRRDALFTNNKRNAITFNNYGTILLPS